MIRAGMEVRARTDYILGTDHCLFWNVPIRDSLHNSYHYMVRGFPRSASWMEQSKYLGGHKRLPLRSPTIPTREDGIFAALQRAVLKPQAQDKRKNAWILEAMLIPIVERVSTRQDPANNQSLIRRLGRVIAAILKGDK